MVDNTRSCKRTHDINHLSNVYYVTLVLLTYRLCGTPTPCTFAITRPVKRLTLVARLPRAFYIGLHAGWNYGIVTPFLLLKIGT